MRAMDTSCTTASVLVQRRVTPGAVLLVVLRLSAELPPASARSTVAMVAASMQCAHGYSGCIRVAITAIRNGVLDGNSATECDPVCFFFIATPTHEIYPFSLCMLVPILLAVLRAE